MVIINYDKRKYIGYPEGSYQEPSADEMYSYLLEEFEGVEGHYYGITNEIYDLGKVIEVIGSAVVQAICPMRLF